MNKAWIILLAVTLTACEDSNSTPKYGKESHLPANCRAYVQESVDGWRSGAYDTDDTMDALERNCGLVGDLWDYEP